LPVQSAGQEATVVTSSSVRPRLLFDPDRSHDACGVGFIASRSATASHGLLRAAVECLHNLDHRGAHAVDGTGDGAGIMTAIPQRLIARELDLDPSQWPTGRLGVVMAFLAKPGSKKSRRVIATALEGEGLELVTWRRVPINKWSLGALAQETKPRIEQAIVRAPRSITGTEMFERKLFLARKAMERGFAQSGLRGASIPSASCRTVVYKGLFTAAHIDDFYLDLKDPNFETDFAIFHQRYSTNTVPSWARAQPGRMLAHNGEINTIQSNRSWMNARAVDLRSEVWEERTPDLQPLLEDGASDSGSLDNALELLVRSGRSLIHSKEILVPPAWENVTDLHPELRSFYEYHAFLTEPWDGPAALAASDGRTLLAGMDRNGLRPARWTLTPDVVLVASEAGVLPHVEVEALATGQLGPGELITVSLETGEVALGEDFRRELAGRRPYGTWIETQTMYVQSAFDDLQDDRFDAEWHARVFGYTVEERRLVLEPMAQGLMPTLSMGNDTALAALSEFPQRVTRYFHQMFAQVTNPPVDPIRERLVMSLRTYIGRRGSLLDETPQQARLIELGSPVLSDAEVVALTTTDQSEFRSAWLPALFDPESGGAGLRAAIEELCHAAEREVREGASIILLSDRETDRSRAPIPMTLAVGAVHHHLIASGIRLRASLVAVTGETRDSHDLACLIALGASAVNPYLAIEQVRAAAADGIIPLAPIRAQANYREMLEVGLLKVLSKMGICTISAYRGSELFEAVGLDPDVAELAFRYARARVGGVGFDRLAADAAAAYADTDAPVFPEGFYKHGGRSGMPHITTPRVALAAKRAARSGTAADWEKYLDAVSAGRPVALLRDLLTWDGGEALPLESVQPAEEIMARFSTAAMSLGALSSEAHEALAEGMAQIGGTSNSGEGGESPARYGTPRNSAIKQVASGRFGVTPLYLASADEFQIKMAQGSKPGEGGQLPGDKVSVEIAGLRHTEPGVTLISPPPHHDIYSIEDLAQLVYDLKTFKPSARVSVKLVSEPGVGTIAVGVAKARADKIIISGSDGGTGASPLMSIKHAGSPWELGLAEAHVALLSSGLRDHVLLETDGGLRTGRDVVMAALLGADCFAFGTLPLLALGCKMVRQCHENTCPVGIATQDLDLRAKFEGAADQIAVIFGLLAEEVRRHLAFLGTSSLDEIRGRTDLLRERIPGFGVTNSLLELLTTSPQVRHQGRYQPITRSSLGEMLAAVGGKAADQGTRVERSFPVGNTDRAVGTRLSGAIAERRLADPTVAGEVDIRLSGTAGQSLGAFLIDGISIRLDGAANDYAGKGMGGGSIAIVPTVRGDGLAHGAGNAVLYGATGGAMFIAGGVGQRFAVRNSGATVVVEGCSDHGCEYMTGGTALILGAIGRNFGAGMTGGVAYVYDPPGVAPRHVAETSPSIVRPKDADLDVIGRLVAAHYAATGSRRAAELLADWDEARKSFWVVRPESRVASRESTVEREGAGA
jgi:glutamate synthase domain-containing protein 2/glutamate synthase domain-containing protein 1/glutamate synthase domain-containing protein 3